MRGKPKIEVWRSIRGYEGIYEVSDFGRVRRIGAASGASIGKLLRPGLSTTKYLIVCLFNRDKGHTYKVHKLVTRAFLGPCPSGHTTDHINHNRTDNLLENLRYLSRSANCSHPCYSVGEDHHFSKLTNEQVREIRRRWAGGEKQKDIAFHFGCLSSGLVSMIVHRKIWKHI